MHVLVIGLDLGTQSLKAVVCDEALAIRGRHAIAYSTSHPEPGRAEQDPRAWDAALAPAIAGALAAAKASPDDIAAIAIAGQLDGCVAVDANGSAIHPALIWQDRRASTEATRVDAKRLFSITGQVADPSHMAPKICWLRTHGVVATKFHQPTSYLVGRLTGEAALDLGHASTTMLVDLATGQWSAELLQAFAVDANELPAIRDTCDVAGTLSAEGARLTGLRPGTKVAVGTGDDFSNPLGAGVIEPGSIVCAIGTAEVVGALSRTLVLDRIADEPMVETHAYVTRNMFFVENPGWLSGGAVRWAVKLLGLPDETSFDALAATAPPGCDGVTFVPALSGQMTPVWRADARGMFYGLTAAHDRAHLARAVLEGLACASRDVADRLRALGLPIADVLLLGGGARSHVWSQLRADTLGLPHRVAPDPDTSPVGAAMIATVAADRHADLASAAACAPATTTAYAPTSANAAALDAAYGRYQKLVAHMGDLHHA